MKKTDKTIAKPYSNITLASVKNFIRKYNRWTENSRISVQKGIVARPITVYDLNQRGQVVLADFQSLPNGFKFTFHYKEHLTKYSVLHPLISKKSSEVAK